MTLNEKLSQERAKMRERMKAQQKSADCWGQMRELLKEPGSSLVIFHTNDNGVWEMGLLLPGETECVQDIATTPEECLEKIKEATDGD